MLRRVDRARRAGDPGGHAHVRRDPRGDEPRRRHQLRLPQPESARVVTDDYAPVPRRPPARSRDGGGRRHRVRRVGGGDAHAEPVAARVPAVAPRQAGGRRAGVSPPRPVRRRVRAVRRAAPSERDPRRAAVLGTELGHTVRHRQPRARHLQPASSTARACRSAPDSRSCSWRCSRRCRIGLLAGFRGGGTDNIAHAGHGRARRASRPWCSRSRSSGSSVPGSRTRCSRSRSC